MWSKISKLWLCNSESIMSPHEQCERASHTRSLVLRPISNERARKKSAENINFHWNEQRQRVRFIIGEISFVTVWSSGNKNVLGMSWDMVVAWLYQETEMSIGATKLAEYFVYRHRHRHRQRQRQWQRCSMMCCVHVLMSMMKVRCARPSVRCRMLHGPGQIIIQEKILSKIFWYSLQSTCTSAQWYISVCRRYCMCRGFSFYLVAHSSALRFECSNFIIFPFIPFVALIRNIWMHSIECRRYMANSDKHFIILVPTNKIYAMVHICSAQCARQTICAHIHIIFIFACRFFLLFARSTHCWLL